MRGNLEIAPDVMEAAEELARQQGKTVGEVISDLARKGLASRASADPAPVNASRFPKRGRVLNDLLDKLRDDDSK